MKEKILCGSDLLSFEGWCAPEQITPHWCDLAVYQLAQMWDVDPGRASMYQTKLYFLLLESISKGACHEERLCCEIICEADYLGKSDERMDTDFKSF